MSLSDAPLLNLFFKKADDGARTSCFAMLAPGLPSGGYLADCELTDVSPSAKDPKAREELWNWTEGWVAKWQQKQG